MARDFRVDGIGLCRTEHMFYDEARITVMREMILADTTAGRRAALDRLLPMQRDDFRESSRSCADRPSPSGCRPAAPRVSCPTATRRRPPSPRDGQPVAQVRARARDLPEVNPMLGMRGVRLGVVMPEIYDMQARAIFEAALAVNRDARAPVVPEVMIPLVSATARSSS
jgi:pyruvate,orthophosphate dikinase